VKKRKNLPLFKPTELSIIFENLAYTSTTVSGTEQKLEIFNSRSSCDTNSPHDEMRTTTVA